MKTWGKRIVPAMVLAVLSGTIVQTSFASAAVGSCATAAPPDPKRWCVTCGDGDGGDGGDSVGGDTCNPIVVAEAVGLAVLMAAAAYRAYKCGLATEPGGNDAAIHQASTMLIDKAAEPMR